MSWDFTFQLDYFYFIISTICPSLLIMITIMYLNDCSSNLTPNCLTLFISFLTLENCYVDLYRVQTEKITWNDIQAFQRSIIRKRNRNSSHQAVKSISFLLLIALLFCSFYAAKPAFSSKAFFYPSFFELVKFWPQF